MYAECSGIMVSVKTGSYKLINRMDLAKLRIKLSDKSGWFIGLDQSTSCTGITFFDGIGDIILMLDCKNVLDGSGDKSLFLNAIKGFIYRTTENLRVISFICERPVEVSYGTFSSNVLRQLLGVVQEWVESNENFKDTVFDTIQPNVWRKYVIDKTKGKNRHKNKKFIAEDVCDIYPSLLPYFRQYPYSGYDSFESCGVLTGYLLYKHTDDGVEKITGTIEKTHTSLVLYSYLRLDTIKSEKDLLQEYGEADIIIRPKYLSYNYEYSKHKNIRMASSNNICVMTILPDNQLESLRWKFNLELDDKHVMVMFIIRKGYFTKSHINVFKALLPMNEEVRNE